MDDRIISASLLGGEDENEISLRPDGFEGFIGHIEEDTYRKNALVFTIEDFI